MFHLTIYKTAHYRKSCLKPFVSIYCLLTLKINPNKTIICIIVIEIIKKYSIIVRFKFCFTKYADAFNTALNLKSWMFQHAAGKILLSTDNTFILIFQYRNNIWYYLIWIGSSSGRLYLKSLSSTKTIFNYFWSKIIRCNLLKQLRKAIWIFCFETANEIKTAYSYMTFHCANWMDAYYNFWIFKNCTKIRIERIHCLIAFFFLDGINLNSSSSIDNWVTVLNCQ